MYGELWPLWYKSSLTDGPYLKDDQVYILLIVGFSQPQHHEHVGSGDYLLHGVSVVQQISGIQISHQKGGKWLMSLRN